MTREEFSRKIGWEWIIWAAGLVNVAAMLPQLTRILETRNVDGLALEMFLIYLGVQVVIATDSFLKKNRALMISMALSAIVSGAIISLILVLR